MMYLHFENKQKNNLQYVSEFHEELLRLMVTAAQYTTVIFTSS